MTSLQIAQRKIKDLRIVISNLNTKYGDGYKQLENTVTVMRGEIMRLNRKNEQLKEDVKRYKKHETIAARVPHLKETIESLRKENANLKKEVEKLTDQTETLRDRIKKTSETSDKPSSANIFKKPISTRTKSGRKPGGQPGHKGHTLRQFSDAKPVDRLPRRKCDCGGPVHLGESYKSKQLVDIKVTLDVTEERVRYGYCQTCGKRHSGAFSDKCVNPVNYGDDIKAIVALLNTRMNLPINKITELIGMLTDSKIRMSDGTVVNIIDDLAKKSVPAVKRIVERLIECGCLLADETGCRVNGNLDWFQIFTSGPFTLFSHNKKRGSLLFEQEDILTAFTGILLHDHFKSYYRYKHLTHAECNEHIDRRLKAVHEILKHDWATELRSFFFDADKRKKELMDKGEYFSAREIKNHFTKFIEILDTGDAEYNKAIEGKNNISRFNEEKCLLRRLRKYANEHLRYITNANVPRGNNGAERCAKEAKRKVRVSGGFRSDKGADNYARMTSIISTLNKHGMDVLAGIKDINNEICPNFESEKIDSS